MNNRKNVWDFFEVRYCLNQDSRPDRWIQATEEFERVGLEVERFASIPADSAVKSFCLSQYAMLKSFLASGKGVLLTLEDDAVFRGLSHLRAVLDHLPIDWDILFLGANITDMVTGIREHPPVRHSEHLYRVYHAWTTHAVAYSRGIAERIIREYDGISMYDAWLSERILPTCKAYLVNPMVAWQRPGKSDLWGQDTDYTGAFIHGDKIMSL